MLVKIRHPHLRCNPFSTLPASLRWRNEIQQRNLAAQIASVLLQRTDWIPVLRSNPRLLSHPSPALFLHILTRTQSHPEMSLRFFNWARSNLGFKPDLRSLSKMVQILIDSDLLDPAKQILAPVLQSEPAAAVLDSMIRVSSSST